MVVDPSGFVGENPEFLERFVLDTEETELLGLDTSLLSENDLMCFPVKIGGYSLSTKHAGFFDVAGFSEVKWEKAEAKELFDNSTQMRTAHSLIKGFPYSSTSPGYSIGGKGNGLVFSFTGCSGTGKTHTAGITLPTQTLKLKAHGWLDYIAEYLKKPIYRVCGADLISDPREIEKLGAALNRIARWKGILLLDDADSLISPGQEPQTMAIVSSTCLP